jgi:hypothetical protein
LVTGVAPVAVEDGVALALGVEVAGAEVVAESVAELVAELLVELVAGVVAAANGRAACTWPLAGELVADDFVAAELVAPLLAEVAEPLAVDDAPDDAVEDEVAEPVADVVGVAVAWDSDTSVTGGMITGRKFSTAAAPIEAISLALLPGIEITIWSAPCTTTSALDTP